ncbi:MAG: protease, partial [Candidatus Aminicenantes bacterium]|nr:protease [Candidatus Aminicenantes bacterium]
MKKIITIVFISLCIAIMVYADDGTRFLHQPDIYEHEIVFVYGRNLWIVNTNDGVAKQLTSHVGSENSPTFSPDGHMIAFSGEYDGNMDVYVISAEDRVPKRLTYHPGVDQFLGWTPNGKEILFSSNRDSYSGFTRIFLIGLEGGFPEVLPMPEASQGCLSPDGSQIAYTPITNAFDYWKRYRGGQTTPLWIFDLNDDSYIEVPFVETAIIDLEKEIMARCNDHNPVWIGDTVYFLSDRDEVMELFGYNTKTKQVNKLFDHGKKDIKNLSGSSKDRKLVYDCEGYIYVYDIEKGQSEKLIVDIRVEENETRQRYKNVAEEINNVDISPTGARVVFEARGELLTVPAKKGDIRNLSNSSGANDRNPVWSPDGNRIAFFSDMDGEYALYVIDQFARNAPKKYSLQSPTFFYNPVWSPDSKKIVYSDNKLNLWYIDLKTGKQKLVDDYITAQDYSWSPDNKWIVYMLEIENGFQIISLYSLETGLKHKITDGMSDARNPVFDKEGKYLYFLASTNAGKTKTLGGSMSTNDAGNDITWKIYIALLQKNLPSPFLPESDEEDVKSAMENKPEEKEPPKKEIKDITIDIDNISDRILALPLPSKNQYGQLQAVGGNKIFFLDDSTIRTFSLKSRKADDFLSEVQSFLVSADGTKILYRSGPDWGVIPTEEKPKPGDGKLNLSSMEIRIDPIAEWRQIFNEAWRYNRDFFYDPGMHGLDWEASKKHYEAMLPDVVFRSDLNYVIGEMVGDLAVGHHGVSGGDMPRSKPIPVGLLGADFEIVDNRYCIKKIYSGLNWNPDLRTPLREPGVNINEGDYILKVNGHELQYPTNIYSMFANTVNKQTLLHVNSKPKLKGARTVIV